MGAGKSAVLAEASDILALRRVVHAAIDLDALALAHLQRGTPDELMYENLRSICQNYAGHGVERFIIARALESQSELDLCRACTGPGHTVVCRLVVGARTLQERVAKREIGVRQQEFLARAPLLHDLLGRAGLEDFTVTNENQPITEVAEEVLRKAAWI
jgi:hypothetical protein